MAAYVLRSASKLLLGARAAVTALYDPTRADMVAALGETTGELVLSRIRDKMLLDPTGRRILRERPLISSQSLDLERLRNLPANTFGRSYIAFLDKHNVTPDSRDEVKYIEDEELAYVMLRYRQVHDFWHTLLDMPITVEGEIALKWFELVQTGLPVTFLSAFVGPLRLTQEEKSRLFGEYVPWAVQSGANAKHLMSVMYEDMFELEHDHVLKKLGIERMPPLDNPTTMQPPQADVVEKH
ncbi:hypothetical protein BASA61_006280 [Batrachochytrium salamandrivorans]|nr:hypothetical protein BASA62_000786 [Batrachochytrium salamandrivorans]KAH6587554.1 hypothetical protein BASA61_006280 [Batrachochytrium salamandrivorans]